jgi:PIN domain nuclease of toxin-antitoxin system
MNLLVDTHALLWFLNRDSQLSKTAREQIEDEGNSALVSIATIWEIAIKVALGKLKLRLRLEDEFERFLEENGFELLSIEYAHAARVTALPRHHGDPFDRLLVAQSMIERMPIISHDSGLDAYGTNRIW